MPEHVLRISLEGDGGEPSGGAGGGGGAIRSGRRPVTSAREQGGGATEEAFDPVAKAFKRIENEQRAAMVQKEYNVLKFGKFGGGIANLAGSLGLPNPISGGVGRAAAMLGPIGVAAGLTAGAGFAANAMTSNLAEKHTGLGLSPDVALASASRQVTQMQTNMRESQQLGPALARWMEAQTSIQAQIAEMMLPIKKTVVEVMAVVLEAIAAALNELRDIAVAFGWLDKKKEVDNQIDAFVQEFLDIGVAGKDGFNLGPARVFANANGMPKMPQNMVPIQANNPARQGAFQGAFGGLR